MSSVPAQRVSRRAVLLGGASLAVLGACGDDKKQTSSDKPGATNADGSKYSLVAFFDGASSVQAGIPQRVTFGLGDTQGALVDTGPAELAVEVLQGKKVVARATSTRHDKGLSRGYYPVSFTPPKAGVYTARTTISGRQVEASFQAAQKVPIPRAGQSMIVTDTPTVSDRRGVNPICTRTPACPLHEVNLRDALSRGKPVALLMATPAYCQTAICGPVLDVLLSQRREFGDQIQMIHAEVYADGKAAAANIASATLAPTLQAYKLPFEPVLFLSRPDRTIAARIDTIFDEDELRSALRTLVA